MSEIKVRPPQDQDAPQLIALIDGCFQEYAAEGVVIELDGIDGDLHAWQTALDSAAGEGLLAFDGDQLIASIGYAPSGKGEAEIKRFYIQQEYRGGGGRVNTLARDLLAWLEMRCASRGLSRIQLWSDTRFLRAHRFYGREGYMRQPKTRDLHDSSNTTEFQFVKMLPAVHPSVQILVDADSCPVKEEVYTIARRHHVPVKLVANSGLRLPGDDLITLDIVGDGFDAADDHIAILAGTKSAVITGDILLAERVLKFGAQALNHKGVPYTADNIGSKLANRALMADLRAQSGEPGFGGPKPFSNQDRAKFKEALHLMLERLKRPI